MTNKPEIRGCINRAIETLELGKNECFADSEFGEAIYQSIADLEAYRDALPAHLEKDLKVMSRPMALHCVEAKTMRDAAKLTAEAISDD